MRNRLLLALAALAALSLVVVAGCGSDNNNNGNDETGGTVTGSIWGSSGGDFVALGGQTVSIGSLSTTSAAETGEFTITGVTPGSFTIVVTPSDPGFGEVLNPDQLKGTVAKGQTKNVGRILLGAKPPNA